MDMIKPRQHFVCLSVGMCVRVQPVQNISTNIEPINFIFSGSLPSDPVRKLFDFEINHPGVRVGVGCPKFGPNDKRL